MSLGCQLQRNRTVHLRTQARARGSTEVVSVRTDQGQNAAAAHVGKIL